MPMISQRFTGLANGATVDATSSATSGTMTLTNGGSGNTSVASTSDPIIGTVALHHTPPASGSWGPLSVSNFPTGYSEVRSHVLVRIPTLGTSDMLDVLGMNIGASSFSVNIRGDGSTHVWSGTDGIPVPAATLPAVGSVIRVATAIKVSGTTANVKVAVYNGDSTTLLGSVYSTTMTVTSGDLPSGMYLTAAAPTATTFAITFGAMRLEAGPGCYDNLLAAESTYTPSATPTLSRVSALPANSTPSDTATALGNLTDGATGTTVATPAPGTGATVELRAALKPIVLSGGGMTVTLSQAKTASAGTVYGQLYKPDNTTAVGTEKSVAATTTATDLTLTWPDSDVAALTTAERENLILAIRTKG